MWSDCALLLSGAADCSVAPLKTHATARQTGTECSCCGMGEQCVLGKGNVMCLTCFDLGQRGYAGHQGFLPAQANTDCLNYHAGVQRGH